MPNFLPKPFFSGVLSTGLLCAFLLPFGSADAETGVAFIDDEFRVNTYTNNNQSFPRIAMAPDGTAVATWESIGQDGDGHAVAAQRYAPDGSPLGAEILVNTTTAEVQSQPSAAMAADGSFVIFWRSRFQDGSEFGAYAQRFDASGARVGNEFLVNVETENNQQNAYGDFDDAGNLMVVWESEEQDGSSGGIYGRVYDSAGQAGDEFQVNTTTQAWQNDVKIAALPSGFVATWESLNVDSDLRAVVFRRYSSTGTPLAGEEQANITEVDHQNNPEVATQPDGTFVIAWESDEQDGSGAAIIARVFASDGTPTSGEIQLNQTTPDDQENIGIAADGQGGFVVVWDGDAASGGSEDEVWGRRFLANGVVGGDEFRVNTNITNRQVFPAIAGSDHGQLLAVWHSWTEDGNGTGVAGQRLWITGLFTDGFESGNTSGWSAVAP